MVLGIVLLAACEKSTAPSTLTGEWQFSEQASGSSPVGLISCSDSGTLRIEQDGTAVVVTPETVTGVCTRGTSSSSGTLDGGIFGRGQINGSSVTFDDLTGDIGCSFIGTVSGSPPNRLEGTEECEFLYPDGIGVTYTGTWSATR